MTIDVDRLYHRRVRREGHPHEVERVLAGDGMARASVDTRNFVDLDDGGVGGGRGATARPPPTGTGPGRPPPGGVVGSPSLPIPPRLVLSCVPVLVVLTLPPFVVVVAASRIAANGDDRDVDEGDGAAVAPLRRPSTLPRGTGGGGAREKTAAGGGTNLIIVIIGCLSFSVGGGGMDKH